MSPNARRGKYVFLFFATPIVADCAMAIVVALSGGLQQVHWIASVFVPLTIAIWIALLFQNGHWSNRALAVGICLFAGAALTLSGILTIRLVAGSLFGHLAGCPSVTVIALGLWYLAAGLAFALLPSVRAFLAHQQKLYFQKSKHRGTEDTEN